MTSPSGNKSGSHPRRLTLVISSLEVGGAQRVMTMLANHWAGQDSLPTLLTLDDGSQPPFFSLHPAVTHRQLNLYSVSQGWRHRIYNNLRRLLSLRRAIVASRPQAVISFMDRTNVLVLFATLGLHVPVVVAEHTAVGAVSLGFVWERLRRLLYPRAAAIVVLTERGRQALPESWQGKTMVIPNPVARPDDVGNQVAGDTGKTCLAMGSLRPEKGFDLLLRAFADVARCRLEWKLVVIGEGGGRQELEALAKQLDVADRVVFPGLVEEPCVYLKSAQMFVLSSRREGFPMALCEAMACGLPVIAADCETGPREIVRPEIDGLLVAPESIETLSSAMARMMDDEQLRQRMGRRGREILERFGLPEVSARWEILLQRLISGHDD